VPEYVAIVRHFADTDKEAVAPDVRRIMRSWPSRKTVTWKELLEGDQPTPIVLIAPSQTGKSTEFEQQARRLRAVGQNAVCCAAAAIVEGIEAGLTGDEKAAYRGWSGTGEPLILLIDAIDELYLRHRNVDDLVRALERDLTLSARKVRLVLSARNATWTEDEARPLHRLLERNQYPMPRLVRFESLDLVAVRMLAISRGVVDIEAFMTAFDENGLDALLDLRPLEVFHFARQWNATKRFGSWSQVMAEFVDSAFAEDNMSRGRRRQLTVRDGWAGVMRVAAACTLMRAPHVSLPTAPAIDGVVSSRALFEDWPSAKLAEFFESPLFVLKGTAAEAVQLPQGPPLYFLMGRWIAERVKYGWKAEEVRDALMVSVYGEARYRIPAHYRAALGWIAACNPGFRRLLHLDHPEIVLFEGDPAELSDAETRVCLDALCKRLAARTVRANASQVFLRRIARAAIEADVLRLLRLHAGVAEVQSFLLTLAEYGRYESCVPLSLELALNQAQSGYVRAAAIDVVGAAGSVEQKQTLLVLTEDGSDQVRTALLSVLAPQILRGANLVRFLARGGEFYFRYELRTKTAARLGDADLDLTLQALHSVIVTRLGDPKLGDHRWRRLESDFDNDELEGEVGTAIALVIERLARAGSVPAHVIELLAGVERLAERAHIYLGDDERRTLDLRLGEDAVARRALWSERIAWAQRTPHASLQPLAEPMFGQIEATDFAWLWGIVRDSQYRFLLHSAWAGFSKEARHGIREAAPPELLGVLDTYAAKDREAERLRIEQEARLEEERVEERRKNNAELDTRRTQIESGDDLRALIWAWEHLARLGTDDMDLVRLLQFVGPDQAETLRRGFIACWRKQAVELPTPGGGRRPTRYLAGLIGLTLEVREGLHLSTLSKSEAQLATRYALNDSALPFWFPDLLSAAPEGVLEVLRPAIDADWRYEAEHDGLLSAAARAPANVSAAIRSRAIELLREGTPANLRTLHWAVDLFLTESSDRALLAEVARSHVVQVAAAGELVEWARLWAHVEPVAAARWLSNAVAAEAVTGETFLRIAELLEQDLEENRGRIVVTGLSAPRALAAWIEALLRLVPVEDESQQGRFRLLGTPDRARDFRQRCLARLARNPSPEARRLLLELLEEPMLAAHRTRLAELVEQQREAAATAMAALWHEKDVLDVEQGDEKPPRSLSELSKLVRRHLAHVHGLVANDDFSYRTLFRQDTKEREIQLWVASSLQERARGLYRIVRENVVDHDKEVDIFAFAPFAGSVPIEIKPIGNYSFKQLEKVIADQLLGRYMLPPDREEGVLLLVRVKHKMWRIDGKPADFEAVMTKLRERAEHIGRNAGKVIHIERIDLLERPAPPGAVPEAHVRPDPPKRKSRASKRAQPHGTRRRKPNVERNR
jgi:hypothetical protein